MRLVMPCQVRRGAAWSSGIAQGVGGCNEEDDILQGQGSRAGENNAARRGQQGAALPNIKSRFQRSGQRHSLLTASSLVHQFQVWTAKTSRKFSRITASRTYPSVVDHEHGVVRYL